MFMNFPAAGRNVFYRKKLETFKKFMELFRLTYFLRYRGTFGIFLTRAGICETVFWRVLSLVISR